jgi:hypothetical protein
MLVLEGFFRCILFRKINAKFPLVGNYPRLPIVILRGKMMNKIKLG